MMGKRWGLLLCLLMGQGLVCRGQVAELRDLQGREISAAALDSFVQANMEALGMPGLALRVIDAGEVVYAADCGWADMAARRPVDAQTRFEAASLSKPVFAYLVMQAVEAGKLDLDRPLFHYLPHRDMEHDPRYRTITARMVLRHTTGFPNWREDNPDGLLDLKFTPDSSFAYSGEGYQYLAEVFAACEGLDHAGLEKLFQEQVAAPLDMRHSTFIAAGSDQGRKARAYREGKVLAVEEDYWHQKEKGKFVAASSLVTTASDFANFILALLREEGLQAASFAELLRAQVNLPADHPLRAFQIGQWGLGFHILQHPLGNLYGHGGDNAGFQSLFHFSPARQWGYVFFTNCEQGNAFGQLLHQYLTGENP